MGSTQAEPLADDTVATSGFKMPKGSQLAQGLAGVALAAALVVWGIPWAGGTSWGAIGHELSRYRWFDYIALGIASLVGVYFYSFILTCGLPGLKHAQGMQMMLASTAVGNTLPGGGFASVVVLYLFGRSWGYPNSAVSSMILVSSAWSFLARCALPAIAFLWLMIGHDHLPPGVAGVFGTGAVLGVGVVVLLFVWLYFERPAVWLTRLCAPVLGKVKKDWGEEGVEASILELRNRMRDVVGNRGLTMTITQALDFLVLYGMFYWCLRSLDVDIAMHWSFAAFAVGRLMTALPLTPGDLGVTEGPTILVLTAAGAASAASAAAVVVFTLFSTILLTPFGVVSWVIWLLTKHKHNEGAADPTYADRPPGGAAPAAAGSAQERVP